MSAASSTSIAKADRHKVLVEWNDTKKDYPIDQCLHQLVEQQVERTPEAIALVFGGQALTYRELNRRANQLAHHLRALGVGPDSLVGVCVERSLEMVIGLLGTLKAGGAYVPLDPEYPKDRLAFMIQDANVPVLLTQKHLVANLPAHSARVMCLDTDWDQMASESPDNPAGITRPDQLAYMIYTSGSTGKPKGAKNHHRGICNRLLWMQDEYRLRSADTVMQKTPFSFDVSVWEFFWPLLTGARLVIARPGGHRDPAYLVDLIEQQNITVLHFVPSMLQIFVEERGLERCGSLRHVICSGEALPYELQERFFSRLSAQLHNLYGPTEAAVDVTYWKCQRGSDRRMVPIGRPVANTQCYVLDPDLQPVPVGEAGELHLGGVQIGYGYHNRAELTAEKFIPDPFLNEHGARLYKTGDLARYLSDGSIEYLGRSDDQVKIRGFRIELGEIESCLKKHTSISDCAVVAREDQPGQKRLVAYLVPLNRESLSVQALRNFVHQQLPEYMVPAVFVMLDALPLSPNGKLDRKALPVPVQTRPDLANPYVAPRTPEEIQLAEIWSQVLQVQPVGVRDNYFELGGDSIRVIQMLARARQKGLHLALEQVFKEQTIERLVPCIRSTPVEAPARLNLQAFELVAPEDRRKLPADLEDAYPLTALQTAIYILCNLSSESAVFLDTHSFKISAAFDQPKLESALYQAVSRHALLRTSFDFADYSELLQLVHQEVRVPFTVEDLRHLTPEEQRKALLAWFAAEEKRPFKWEDAPLVRFHVQVYGERQFQLIVSIHHIIFDGWSLAALLTQVFQDYFSMLNGARPSVSPLRTSYREYVALEKKAVNSEDHRRFWTEKLAEPTISTVPRWPRSMCEGGAVQLRGPEITVPTKIFEGLKQLAQSAGVPLRTVLHAAHMKVMSVLYGTSDVLSSMISNGRPEELDAEQMVGLFLNSVPVRMKLTGGSWLELCRQTFAVEQEIMPHRRFPLVEAQRLAGGQTLVETVFDFTNFHVYRGLEGYPNCRFEEGHYFEANDFTLATYFLLDITSTVLELHIYYDPDQLPKEQIREFCDYYMNTLAAMASEPAARYESFSPLSEIERKKLLVDWNHTALEHGTALESALAPPVRSLDALPAAGPPQRVVQGNDKDPDLPLKAPLHKLFEAHAARTPDAVAVVSDGHSLSYSELDRRANRLAHALRRRRVGPDVLVALSVNRTPDMIVALLGIFKAGGAYVPLDPEYPADRLAFMLEDCGAKVLITEERLQASLLPLPAISEVIYLDRDTEALAAERQDAPRSEVDLSNLAYAIYTSGSTGKPKAALLTHRGLLNLAMSEIRLYGIGPQSRVLQSASLSFDTSLSEIAMALCSGATLYVEARDSILPGADLEGYLDREKITVLSLTPSALAFVDPSAVPSVEQVVVGGEPCSVELAERWARRCRFFNAYGPTEATITATSIEYRDGALPPVIGRPLPNVRVYILDQAREPVPVGVAGELYIGGIGVARGYLNRPELTAEKFIADPFDTNPRARLYRTGDLVRYLPNGNMEFLGRIDQQVKIRGFRVEPGEIEAALSQCTAIREVAVFAREDSPGDKRLVAYVVAEDRPADLVDQLRAHLRASLPEYMVPAAFVTLDALPLTPNGKVDRKALPAPDAVAYAARRYEAPVGEIETALAQIWAEVLKLERVGRHDNFFELGGHSLLTINVIQRMRRAGLHAEARVFFARPTLAVLAAAVGRESSAVEVPANRIPPGSDALTPEMLPLVKLSPQDIERIVGAVPGGAANVQDIYPLAPLQEGILYHHLMATEGDPYLLYNLFAFDSRTRLERYLEALQAVIERHDTLRTAVLWEGLPEGVQVVWRRASLTVEEVSLNPAAGDVAQQLRARFDPRHYRLDVRQAPLLRAFIAQDAANARWVMLLLNHHLSGDHITKVIMQQEIQAYLLGQAGQLPAPLPFRNFVAQARLGVSREEHESFFRRMLGDVDEPTAPFGLIDVQGDGSGIAEARRPVDAALARRLRARALSLGVSAASVFHLAWALVLARASGRDDAVFGTVLSGRMNGGEGADRVLGLFMNTLPVRIRVGEVSAQDSVRNMHAQLVQLLRHEHAPLALAQRCSAVAAPAPLFSALLNYRHSTAVHVPEEALQGWEGIQTLGFEERTNYPLVLSVDDLGEGFALVAQVLTPIGPGRICAYMHTALEHLVGALERAPATPVRSLDVMPEAERQQLLVEWNETDTDYPADASIHELFEAQAKRTPEAVAVVFKDQSLTYRELDRRTNQLARYLQKRGVGPDTLVALCLERSLDMVVGALGILKAGGAYVPLDPDYPTSRLTFMFEDTAAPVLLTQTRLRDRLPQYGGRTVTLDADWTEIARETQDNPNVRVSARNLAYVIYTSGSTGRPKGVAIEHRNAVNFLHWAQSSFSADDLALTLFSTSLNFDLAMYECFAPLTVGATTKIVQNALDLARTPLDVTLINTVPSAINALLDIGGVPNTVRTINLAGEPLKRALVERLFAQTEVNMVCNLYGPSETTTYSTWVAMRREQGFAAHIGRPISNTRIYLLDTHGRPVPIGVAGEICIGGDGVARGYLNRPELTAERFVADPFSTEPNARMYKTGDLGRYLPDANIEFLGRIDHQVKIRGFRVELGEIEAVLGEHPGVRQAVVYLWTPKADDVRLVACCVPAKVGVLAPISLLKHLRARLPDYMIPQYFLPVTEIPLTPTGKVDRRRLPTPVAVESGFGQHEAPADPVEARIAEIWANLIGPARPIGRGDRFFEMGGHSLLALRALGQMEQEFGVKLDLRVLFHDSLADIATRYRSHRSAQSTGEGGPGVALSRYDGASRTS